MDLATAVEKIKQRKAEKPSDQPPAQDPAIKEPKAKNLIRPLAPPWPDAKAPVMRQYRVIVPGKFMDISGQLAVLRPREDKIINATRIKPLWGGQVVFYQGGGNNLQIVAIQGPEYESIELIPETTAT